MLTSFHYCTPPARPNCPRALLFLLFAFLKRMHHFCPVLRNIGIWAGFEQGLHLRGAARSGPQCRPSGEKWHFRGCILAAWACIRPPNFADYLFPGGGGRSTPKR